ncbi:MAG: hypothetical protein EA425_03915 [Puniceicoccaceae bacterium]|nr:MAG: hypothetical protein EA425_03915 [Puniceicoccaceae bacterium]
MTTKLVQILAWGLLIALAAPSAGLAATYRIIAHPEVPATTLTTEAARDILLGNRTRWEGGPVIRLAVLAGGPVHEAVMNEVAGRSPLQFDNFWKRQVFTGRGVMPQSCRDDAEMIAYIARTPGAFGYISSETDPEGVKVLPVQ